MYACKEREQGWLPTAEDVVEDDVGEELLEDEVVGAVVDEELPAPPPKIGAIDVDADKIVDADVDVLEDVLDFAVAGPEKVEALARLT